MKISMTLFGLFLAVLPLSSQNSSALPSDNAIWDEWHITFFGPITYYTALCGDTLINQENWSRVDQYSVDSNLNVKYTIYLGALRSEGTKAWFIAAETTETILLYDFDLKAGDSIALDIPWSNWPVMRVVDFTDQAIIGGKLRKVIHFKPYSWGFENEIWMEGIGSNLGLLNRGQEQGFDNGFSLSCFKHHEEVINFYTEECVFPELSECLSANTKNGKGQSIEISITPNPAGESVTVGLSDTTQNEWLVQVFNMMGQQILEQQFSYPSTTVRTAAWAAGPYLIAVRSVQEYTVRGRKLLIKQ